MLKPLTVIYSAKKSHSPPKWRTRNPQWCPPNILLWGTYWWHDNPSSRSLLAIPFGRSETVKKRFQARSACPRMIWALWYYKISIITNLPGLAVQRNQTLRLRACKWGWITPASIFRRPFVPLIALTTAEPQGQAGSLFLKFTVYWGHLGSLSILSH